MDVRRALELLGLSRPTSEVGLRRAYLKAVRAHAPERDPHGFAEVRAAYELLVRCLPELAASSEFEPGPPDSAPASDAQPAPPSWRARVPSSPPARANAVRAPGASPANDFLALLAASHHAAAAQLLLRAWATGSGIAAQPVDVFTCTLQLFEGQEFGLATELLREFEAVAERAGVRPSAFGSAVIARWVLLSELARLPGHVNQEVIAAFAAAVRSGRYRRAGRLLGRELAADPSLAARVAGVAPVLFAAARLAGRDESVSLRPAGVGPP
jgi:hypothetical protein